jgi:hypothetical protein
LFDPPRYPTGVDRIDRLRLRLQAQKTTLRTLRVILGDAHSAMREAFQENPELSTQDAFQLFFTALRTSLRSQVEDLQATVDAINARKTSVRIGPGSVPDPFSDNEL